MELRHIQQLPPEVIGQIAAGEVVERPAAAIKELVENSMDAGATAITVDIKEGGLASFRVADNGSGIPPSDIRLAFARHATSKIRTAEDLYGVRSLGFRGEALASIAAVSKLTCQTRARGQEMGVLVRNEGGEILSIQDAACPEGTTFTVKELFYNAPVRRKFLKKPAAETAAVSELMARLILSHPATSFRFMADGKLVYFSAGDGNLDSAILSVYGTDTLKLLTKIDGNMNGVMLSGFVGVGDAGRGNRSHEHFFLNGRAMKSPLLSSAVENACRQRVTIGRFPLCVLHLTMPFENADVNVHPNKWEVRFQDERSVREAVETIVFEALAKTDAAPPIPPMYLKPQDAAPSPAPAKIQVSQPATPPEDAPAALKKPDNRLSAFTEDGALPTFAPPSPKKETAPIIPPLAPAQPAVLRDSGASLLPPRMDIPALKHQEGTPNQANTIPSEKEQEAAPSQANASLHPDGAVPKQTDPALIQNETEPAKRPTDQSPSKAGPTQPTAPVPDPTQPAAPVRYPAQPAAPAADPEQVQAPMVEAAFRQIPLRVLGVAFNTYIVMEYGDLLILSDQHAVHERLLYEQFMRETAAAPASQALLIPLIVTLSPAEYACYEENKETLEKAGFDLAPFGDGTVQLRGVPIVLGQPQAESCLLEALDELTENPSLAPADRTSRVIQMACKHAVKGGERLPEESVKQLIRDVIEQKVTPTCPHGRPLMVQITRNELEKRFRRIQN